MPARKPAATPSQDRLEEYRRKRSFDKTPEPAGGTTRAVEPRSRLSRFVVQKHRASRLHFDLRLEMNGVLASWAVPKGPSLDPQDRRLAVHVEDHPIEYFDFEGTIPKGEYGGGTVMVWDWGGVLFPGDPNEMIARGDLKFELFGRKLKGAFALVQSRPGSEWLLIKKRDHGAVAGSDIAADDVSVLSSRTMDEIAAAGQRVWRSDLPAGEQPEAGFWVGGGFGDLSKARKATLPKTLEPMMAQAASAAFDDPAWSYELKLDGFRTLAVVDGDRVRLRSRKGLDATAWFPELASLAVLVRARGALLDGEVVALDEAGLPSFGRLQERTGWRGGPSRTAPHPTIPVVYYVFDLLHYDGLSLVEMPLQERRRMLQATILDGPNVRLLDTFPGDVGEVFYEAARAQGQEGVVAKRLDSPYRPGQRPRSWLKIKAIRTQACAVVGYRPPEGGRKHLGSLALGVIEDGRLAYCGQVGSGFDERSLELLRDALEPKSTRGKADIARLELAPKGLVWVKPELVCEVKYNEWTREKLLRQATFLRLRSDLAVEDCHPEPG